MAKPTKKGRGRPPKAATERKRNNVTMRMRDGAKAALEAAAAANQRSLSEEIEFRLQRSFMEEGLFSSPETRRWAILLAAEFHKAGTAAAGQADDATWMKHPDCMLQASFSVMNALVLDLARQPGADLDQIDMWLENLRGRFHARQRSGFIEPSREDARAQRAPKRRAAK